MFIRCFRNINDKKFYVPIVVCSSSLINPIRINFLIDTGATLTQISWNDASDCGIPIRTLPVSLDNPHISGIGGTIKNYILQTNTLIFKSNIGRFDIKMNNLNVMDLETIDGITCPLSSSMLGIDILQNFDFLTEQNNAYLRRKNHNIEFSTN